MARHPQANLGRKTVPNLLFESFWIVSKVSKEEVFMKTGVDITKTAQDREKILGISNHFHTSFDSSSDVIFSLPFAVCDEIFWGGLEKVNFCVQCIHQRPERGDLPWILWGFYLNFIQQGVLLAGTKGSFCHCGHGMLIVIGSLDKFFSENAYSEFATTHNQRSKWQAPIRGKKHWAFVAILCKSWAYVNLQVFQLLFRTLTVNHWRWR